MQQRPREQEAPWPDRPHRKFERHRLAGQDENRPKRDKAPPDHPPGDEPKPAAPDRAAADAGTTAKAAVYSEP